MLRANKHPRASGFCPRVDYQRKGRVAAALRLGRQAMGTTMKIAFVDTSGLVYTPETPFSRPLGGTQSAACFLSSALSAQGHLVSLMMTGASQQIVMGVRCEPFDIDTCAAELNTQDAVVVLSAPIAAHLRQVGVVAPLICWQHNATNSSRSKPFGEPAEKASWTTSVFVSDYQRQSFVAEWGVTGSVIGNAINPTLARSVRTKPTFVDRQEDPILFYASAPGRGLDFLLIAFPTIRKALPNVRLKVFSDQAMYQVAPERDEFAAYYELARNLPGVEYVGGISQSDLAAEMLAADIWSYPTTFIETSCIVMMEAAAAGCLLAGSEVGALRETAGRFGRLLPPGRSKAGWAGAYARAIVREVERVRQDPAAYRTFVDEQMAWFRKTCDWERRAEQWTALLEDIKADSHNNLRLRAATD